MITKRVESVLRFCGSFLAGYVVLVAAGGQAMAADALIGAEPTVLYVQRGEELRQVVRISVSRTPDGSGGNPPVAGPLFEFGNWSFVDTNRPFGQDVQVSFFEVFCTQPGKIQFRVYRRQANTFVLVGKDRAKEMKAGLNRFELEEPIAAKRGDCVGFWLAEGVKIAARNGKGIYCVKGEWPEEPIPTEKGNCDNGPRACSIWAFGKDQVRQVDAIRSVRKSGVLEVSSPLEKRAVPLASLRKIGDSYVLDVAQVKEPTDVKITLKSGKLAEETTVRVVPEPKWRLFTAYSVHVDIGFNDLQELIARDFVNNVAEVADWCRRMRHLPEPERHRWHFEASWELDMFIRDKGQQAIGPLVELFKDGLLELDAQYANMHTGVCSAEELVRSLYFSAAMERKWGIPARTAMLTDTPTYTWAVPSLLAGAGVRYLSVGQNAAMPGRSPTKPLFPWDDVPENVSPDSFNGSLRIRGLPFYWEGPDGSKVLVAHCRQYPNSRAVFHNDPWTLSERLRRMSAEGYPFDALLLHGLYNDNDVIKRSRSGWARPLVLSGKWPDTSGSHTVGEDKSKAHERDFKSIQQWNKTWAYPQAICGTVEQFGRYMEENFKDRIKTVRGHWGDSWEDGTASAAHEMGLNRQSHELLTAAETLAAWAWSLGLLPEYPAEKINQAYSNVLLFDEHTWGASTSISRPEHEFTLKQWQVKSAFATDGASQTASLWHKASAVLASGIKSPAGDSIIVMNPLSWVRTDVARVELPQRLAKANGLRVTDQATGKAVPCQRDGAQLVFLAGNVPPVGYKVFGIEPAGSAPPAAVAVAGTDAIETSFYRAVADKQSGGLVSLRDKQLGRELVDANSGFALNEYVYDPAGVEGMSHRRRGPKDARPRRPQKATVARSADGPVFTSLLCRTSIEGTPDIQQQIILYHGIKRVDFVNRIDKELTYDIEQVYYAFPFAVKSPRFTLELPGAIAEADKDLMPCANRNWFGVEHWVDVRGNGFGVTWAPIEAPLVSLGGMYHEWIKEIPRDKGWLFSYIMNNLWLCNFKAGQGGNLTFRYALTSNKGPLDRVAATRFGAQVSSPLPCTLLTGRSNGKLPEAQASFCTTQPDNVVIQTLKRAEDGRGIIVRLREVAGKPTAARVTFPLLGSVSARLTDLVERDGKPLVSRNGLVEVNVPANGWATVRIMRQK